MIGRTNIGGGSAEKSIINAVCNIGDTVTVSMGTIIQTKTLTSGTTLVFTVLKFGTWTIRNLTSGFVDNLVISESGEYNINTLGYVYGIKRLRTSSSTEWERTDRSANYTATATAGTVVGSSDFDDKYPWSEIQRVTFSSNDVMVKIPKFWYRRYVDADQYEYIQISDNPRDGFSLHPAFLHNDTECDCIYISAYQVGPSASDYKSKTGVAQFRTYLDNHRSLATSKGTGWGVMDYAALSALQMLYLVEFADYNSQAKVAIGRMYTTGTNPVWINNGNGDSLEYYTGYTLNIAINPGLNFAVYRGIENPWANNWNYIDGIYLINLTYYVSLSQDVYDAINYKSPVATAAYITRLGYDPDYSWVMMPSEASGGSATTYIPDDCNLASHATNKYVLMSGGSSYARSASMLNGLFSVNMTLLSSNTGATYCCHLMYIPQEGDGLS